MNSCNVRNCRKPPTVKCSCNSAIILICSDHLPFHLSDTSKTHNYTPLKNNISLISDCLQALQSKIVNECVESVNVLKHRMKSDLDLIRSIRSRIMSPVTLNNQNSSFTQILNNIETSQPYFNNHFDSLKVLLTSILDKKEKISIPVRPNSAYTVKDSRRFREEVKNEPPQVNINERFASNDFEPANIQRTYTASNQGAKAPAIQEMWYVAPETGGLKALPAFIVKQLADAKSKGFEETRVFDQGRLIKLADLKALRLYNIDEEGEKSSYFQRIVITKKKSHKKNN